MEDKDTNYIKECEYFTRRRKSKELILKLYFFIHSFWILLTNTVSISAHVHQYHYYAISEFHVNTPKEKKFKLHFYDSPLMALMKSLLSTNNLFPSEIKKTPLAKNERRC